MLNRPGLLRLPDMRPLTFRHWGRPTSTHMGITAGEKCDHIATLDKKDPSLVTHVTPLGETP
jgi:hypothetical protein